MEKLLSPKMNPRVLHVVPSLFGADGVVGGAERYAFELARHMAERTAVRLVTFGRKDEVRRIGELEVHILQAQRYVRGEPSNPFAWPIVADIRRADIVHCHQQHIVASSLAAAICRLTSRKVFVTDLGGGGWDISGYVSTDKWYHGHLHISEYSRGVVGHSDKRWAHVIYGGVDTARFSPASGVQRDGTVLYVGRILPHKGINYLIEALPDDMSLEIIGQPYDPRYVADLRALSGHKKVTFRANCGDDQLIEAYRRAMCVVLPSVYETMYGNVSRVPELLGQTLLEGMACGTPVMCTDVASMPEVVRAGETGFVVAPNDPGALREKLCWFRDHPQQTRLMGEAGRAHVLENFTWPAVVTRCLDIYAS